MNYGQLISGLILSIGGLFLSGLSLFNSLAEARWVGLFYGIPALVLGLVILFYKKEDKIEQIKQGRKK